MILRRNRHRFGSCHKYRALLVIVVLVESCCMWPSVQHRSVWCSLSARRSQARFVARPPPPEQRGRRQISLTHPHPFTTSLLRHDDLRQPTTLSSSPPYDLYTLLDNQSHGQYFSTLVAAQSSSIRLISTCAKKKDEPTSGYRPLPATASHLSTASRIRPSS